MLLETFTLLVAVMLCMHGVSHGLWFMASWTSVETGVGDGPWILPGDITIKGRVGKALGLLALIVVFVFVTAALMLLANLPEWRSVANVGVFLSYGVVVPWLRQGPGQWPLTSVMANIILMFLLALPISVDIAS